MPWPKGKPRPPEVSRKAAATLRAATDAEREATTAAVLKFLAGGGGYTKAELQDATGCNAKTIEAVMATLHKDGAITHVGLPWRYYLR